VEPEGDAGVVPEHVIVELAAAGEAAGGAPAPLLVEATGLIFEEQWVLRRVELEVGGPEPDELVHLLAHDLRHALKKVGGSGKLLSRSPATRSWRRGSGSAASPSGYAWFAPSVDELLNLGVPPAPELADDAQRFRSSNAPVADLDLLSALPVAPEIDVYGTEIGVYGRIAETLDRLGQLALQRLATHLAVGDDRKALFFLEL
jgi:hypothetical protein